MDGNIWIMLLIQALLIALNAVFSTAETAVSNINTTKLEKLISDGNKRAAKLGRLTKDSQRTLSAFRIAITLAGFLGSAFAAEHFSKPLANWVISLGVKLPAALLQTLALILVTLVLSYFTLLLGELVPKRIAAPKSDELALKMSPVIGFIAALFSPIVWVLTKSANGVLLLCGIDPNHVDDISEEDIRDMVDSSAKSGSIDNTERDFIQNVFEFDDLTAGEIATHRTEVTLLWLDESDAEWDEKIHHTCHNFYPVCGESVDNVVGVLYLKDYFRQPLRTREAVMKAAVKTPYFVPESVKADVLFRNMKDGHKTFAVVLDEYGGMRGIITMYDLIERLVGSLGSDELAPTKKATPTIVRVDSNTWKLSGSVPLDDIQKELGTELPCDDYDTFSGLVFSELGTIPDDGSSVEVDVCGLHVKVTSIRDHLIETATIISGAAAGTPRQA